MLDDWIPSASPYTVPCHREARDPHVSGLQCDEQQLRQTWTRLSELQATTFCSPIVSPLEPMERDQKGHGRTRPRILQKI
jgi:hypothetical protein